MKCVWPLVVTASFAMGCIGGKKQISAEDKSRLQAQVLDAVPADAKKVDVNFENKVHLVGYKVEPELAPPGTPVKLAYYWRCDDPLDEGWQLFTHVEHEGFGKSENLDANGPLRELKGNHQVFGPDRWERGKVYADEQTFTMPADLKGPDTVVYVGLWKGDARLRILSGSNDGDNRAIVTKIRTGLPPRKEAQQRSPSELPSLAPRKLTKEQKIVVDGKGDEPAWATAASTEAFVDVGTGRAAPSYPVQGRARVAWDDEAMYVLIDIKDDDVIGYFTNKASQPQDWTATGQPMTWTKDTAEIMIDPDGDGDNLNYYEIQINPANKVFKSQFDSYNAPKVEPQGPFGHEDWEPKLRSAVVVRGTLDKTGDKDDGYTVETSIPWSAFSKGASHVPPKAGDTWRVNFYAMQNNWGTAWAPILGQGNFHRASRFGRIVWSADALVGVSDAGPSDAGSAALSAAVAADGGRSVDSGRRPRLPLSPAP